jgi:hypothetical protein
MGLKPKGMHWKTFNALNKQHNSHAKIANLYLAAWLRSMNLIG